MYTWILEFPECWFLKVIARIYKMRVSQCAQMKFIQTVAFADPGGPDLPHCLLENFVIFIHNFDKSHYLPSFYVPLFEEILTKTQFKTE